MNWIIEHQGWFFMFANQVLYAALWWIPLNLSRVHRGKRCL